MKYLTSKNMEKATRMIMDKGYDINEAEHMAMNSFALVRGHKFYHHVEYFIDKILTKEEYKKEYGLA